jgi:hypothetical protein
MRIVIIFNYAGAVKSAGRSPRPRAEPYEAMTPPISRRDFIRDAAILGASVALLPRIGSASQEAADGSWLTGDLHCHTVYSHDVWGGPGDDNTGPEDAYTLGWKPADQIQIAELRGLDFLAITDHNDVRAVVEDDGYKSTKLTLLHGYEHSLSKGHAGCLIPDITETFHIDTSTDAGALALRDEVHNAQGLFILNHPFYDNGWGYTPAVRPDSIEVWNISWPYRHVAPNVPSTPAVSDNYKSLPYWEESFLSSGPMPATGGSDNHYRATTAVQGVGQPTTWVFAKDRSQGAILEGIRAGRTGVSAEPPGMGGARIELTAHAGSTTWMVGDTVPASTGEVTVVARVVNAPAHLARFVLNGANLKAARILTPDQTMEMTVDAASVQRIRAEAFLNDGFWMGALTSPIYFGAPAA